MSHVTARAPFHASRSARLHADRAAHRRGDHRHPVRDRRSRSTPTCSPAPASPRPRPTPGPSPRRSGSTRRTAAGCPTTGRAPRPAPIAAGRAARCRPCCSASRRTARTRSAGRSSTARRAAVRLDGLGHLVQVLQHGVRDVHDLRQRRQHGRRLQRRRHLSVTTLMRNGRVHSGFRPLAPIRLQIAESGRCAIPTPWPTSPRAWPISTGPPSSARCGSWGYAKTPARAHARRMRRADRACTTTTRDSAVASTWRAIASASASTSTSPPRCPRWCRPCARTPIRRWPRSPTSGRPRSRPRRCIPPTAHGAARALSPRAARRSPRRCCCTTRPAATTACTRTSTATWCFRCSSRAS